MGILPIRENLFKRKVSRELICPVCSSDCETFPHFFLECRNAQIMWRLSPIGYVPDMNGDASILNWFDKLIDRWKGTAVERPNLTLATTIMWRIWKCRNEVIPMGVY